MVWAANSLLIDTSERQRGAPMGALLGDDSIPPALVAVNHQILADQTRGLDRLLIGKLTRAGDGHPVAAQQFTGGSTPADSGKCLVFFSGQHIIFLGSRLNGSFSYFPFSAAAMISFAKSKIGFMS